VLVNIKPNKRLPTAVGEKTNKQKRPPKSKRPAR
jgi:hypothetical protein